MSRQHVLFSLLRNVFLGYLEDETLAIFQPQIDAGIASVVKDDKALCELLVNRYPFVFNRIDWDKCP